MQRLHPMRPGLTRTQQCRPGLLDRVQNNQGQRQRQSPRGRTYTNAKGREPVIKPSPNLILDDINSSLHSAKPEFGNPRHAARHRPTQDRY